MDFNKVKKRGGNVRNARTTHPRKAARRATAMENFTLVRKQMNNTGYMARKAIEWAALGGTSDSFKFCVQRLA